MGYRVGDVVVGRYQLVDRLGKGAFGQVFRAIDVIEDQAVAVKVLGSDADPERVKREYLPLRRIDHPNIVKALNSLLTEEGMWVVVTELVEGCSLREYLGRWGRLDLDEVYEFGTQLLEALTAIHPDERRIAELEARRSAGGLDGGMSALLQELKQGGLVHRDIKPDNVIVRDDDKLVLVDFGISSRAGSTIETMSCTPDYLPPDLPISALDRWDPDVDRYAAAATIFEAACGVLPHVGVDRLTQVRDPASLGVTLPATVRDFLVKACWPDKAFRFDATADMYVAWHAAWTVPDPHPAAPFQPWIVRSIPPLDQLDDEEVRELVLDIVAAEGPILVARLYDLIRAASGTRPKARLNRIVHRMATPWNGRLAQVERPGGGQQDKTVYISGTDPRVFRTLGERPVHHLPQVELETHLQQARRSLGIADGLDGDLDRVLKAAVASLVPNGSPSECQSVADYVCRRM